MGGTGTIPTNQKSRHPISRRRAAGPLACVTVSSGLGQPDTSLASGDFGHVKYLREAIDVWSEMVEHLPRFGATVSPVPALIHAMWPRTRHTASAPSAPQTTEGGGSCRARHVAARIAAPPAPFFRIHRSERVGRKPHRLATCYRPSRPRNARAVRIVVPPWAPSTSSPALSPVTK